MLLDVNTSNICLDEKYSFAINRMSSNVFLTTGACFSFVILAAVTKFYSIMPAEGSDLAYGLADSGNAMGMICLPILAEYMREVYGWRGAILLLAGVTSNLSICIIMMKEPAKQNASNDIAELHDQEDHISEDDLQPLLPNHPPERDPRGQSGDAFDGSNSGVTESYSFRDFRRNSIDQTVDSQTAKPTRTDYPEEQYDVSCRLKHLYQNLALLDGVRMMVTPLHWWNPSTSQTPLRYLPLLRIRLIGR